MHRPVYVIMIADGLEPNWHQAISNHHINAIEIDHKISSWHTYHITHKRYRVTVIKQTILTRGGEADNLLVSLLLTASSSHDDNALCSQS